MLFSITANIVLRPKCRLARPFWQHLFNKDGPDVAPLMLVEDEDDAADEEVAV